MSQKLSLQKGILTSSWGRENGQGSFPRGRAARAGQGRGLGRACTWDQNPCLLAQFCFLDCLCMSCAAKNLSRFLAVIIIFFFLSLALWSFHQKHFCLTQISRSIVTVVQLSRLDSVKQLCFGLRRGWVPVLIGLRFVHWFLLGPMLKLELLPRVYSSCSELLEHKRPNEITQAKK